MDLGKFHELWEDFLAFLDRTVQWLGYLFGGDENAKWPPEKYPDIDAPYPED